MDHGNGLELGHILQFPKKIASHPNMRHITGYSILDVFLGRRQRNEPVELKHYESNGRIYYNVSFFVPEVVGFTTRGLSLYLTPTAYFHLFDILWAGWQFSLDMGRDHWQQLLPKLGPLHATSRRQLEDIVTELGLMEMRLIELEESPGLSPRTFVGAIEEYETLSDALAAAWVATPEALQWAKEAARLYALLQNEKAREQIELLLGLHSSASPTI